MPSPRLVPWLSVPDATAAAEFYATAFGATELERLASDEGGIEVAQLAIGEDAEARFWVQRDPDADTARSPVRMILTVDDPDTVFAAALTAGATEVFPVSEGHGWRVGRLVDPSGHHWEIGRPLLQ